MKTVHIKKDQKERYNLKRGWYVNAWRIVDEKGNDMIQPWFDKKKEAIEQAEKMGYKIISIDQ